MSRVTLFETSKSAASSAADVRTNDLRNTAKPKCVSLLGLDGCLVMALFSVLGHLPLLAVSYSHYYVAHASHLFPICLTPLSYG